MSIGNRSGFQMRTPDTRSPYCICYWWSLILKTAVTLRKRSERFAIQRAYCNDNRTVYLLRILDAQGMAAQYSFAR